MGQFVFGGGGIYSVIAEGGGAILGAIFVGTIWGCFLGTFAGAVWGAVLSAMFPAVSAVAGAIVGGWFRVLFGGLWGSGDRVDVCFWVENAPVPRCKNRGVKFWGYNVDPVRVRGTLTNKMADAIAEIYAG